MKLKLVYNNLSSLQVRKSTQMMFMFIIIATLEEWNLLLSLFSVLRKITMR